MRLGRPCSHLAIFWISLKMTPKYALTKKRLNNIDIHPKWFKKKKKKQMLGFHGKNGVVEDSFKLPTKSITDHWNSLNTTSALSFHRYYVKPLKHLGLVYLFFPCYRSNPPMEFWPVVNRTPAKAVLGTLGPSCLQSSQRLWKVYTFLAYLCFVMGLTWNYLLPTPPPSRESKFSWNCYSVSSWSLELPHWSNNFVSGCKKAFWGWGNKEKIWEKFKT